MLKIISSILSFLVGVSLIGYAGVSYTVRDLESNIEIIATDQLLGDIEDSVVVVEDDAETVTEIVEALPVTVEEKKDITIALVGSDTRTGQGGGFGKASGSRSDTTILIKMNAERTNAAVISLARDLRVSIPACEKENGKKLIPQTGKFNAAYAYAGPNCMLATIEENFGIRVDHIAVVNFTGFQKIVDIIGGVEVCLAKPAKDRDAKLNLPAGRQLLSGEDALAFVRARKGLGDGSDISRSERQKMFLGSVISTAEKNGVIYDVGKLYQLLSTISSSLAMDKELASVKKMLELVLDVSKIGSKNVQFIKLPWASNGDGSVRLTSDSEKIIEKFINTEFPIGIVKKKVEKPITPSADPLAGAPDGNSRNPTILTDRDLDVPAIPEPTKQESEFEKLGFSADLDM
jgi:LCP family protein required for cell wall assembly